MINVISTRLSRPALYIASCSIGIHRRARPINSWVQADVSNNSNIGILVVCGIGGIGKTTLAKFAYNLNFGYFEISCFLANIRETSKLPNGLITLQKQLLSILLKNEKVKISSVDEGIIKIRNALCYRKVLLVLDDVDVPDLVEAIFDMKDWFGLGTLQVIGSSLAGKSKDVWRSAIEKLRDIPTNKIVDKLRLSYELLEDDHDQNLFLHLSCFFVWMKKDFVVCEFDTLEGLQNLIDRSLVTIDEYVNDIRMHQLVRDMGRDIVCREALTDPGKHSRLWHHANSYNVLGGKTVSTKFNKVQVNGSYKNFPKGLRWLCWSGFPEECIPNEFPMGSVVSIDMRYSSLKKFWNGFKFLQYLEILDVSHSYELVTTPDLSGLPNLEKLILEHCTKLINVDDTIGCLQKVILLNLKDCQKLKSLPDSICKLKCLVILDISGCSNIEYLPTELDKLTSLKELYADGINLGAQTRYSSLWSWARKQRVSPIVHEIHFPRSLHELDIANSNLSLDAFKNVDLGIVSLLTRLKLEGNPISNLPDSIKNLTRLKYLGISYCTKIKRLNWLPSNLSELNASGCISLEKVASNCAKGYPVEGYINGNKLIEVAGVFKLEPLENTGAQVLAFMGISNLQPMTSMMVSLVFGRVSNIVGKKYPSFVCDDVASLFSLSPNKLPPQILYHCGVFSTFLPGESVSNWFSYKFTDAADVYCTLPNNLNSHRTINGLSICFVYKCPEPYTNVGLYDGPAIWLRNQTKDLNWAFYPAWFGLPEDDQSGMMWLSYWKVENLFQQGDVIEVMGSPQFAEFKELGVKIFYLDEQTENYYDSNMMMSTKSNKPFEDILGYYFDDEVNTYYICI
ncbi:hypothetical protein R3W88_003220 [Solanum pinnatisectum]|uniref:TMV resistance protein N n=1 Tax=Solanum pinnatisectum TaxID=50273 RepID=A0AAV9MNF1_9SOLN|nr:hypothetical protein R3W88_003220 [Solanum pinnatisectum]